jgi:hypothetical protein
MGETNVTGPPRSQNWLRNQSEQILNPFLW